jgi:hypothetical protein
MPLTIQNGTDYPQSFGRERPIGRFDIADRVIQLCGSWDHKENSGMH